jgi:hypothetical protein
VVCSRLPLAKAADPSRQVTIYERNRPEDTFGFGVVFSDATLDGIHAADPVLRFTEAFRPGVAAASAKFIWLGTTYPFDGLTFVHERGPDGVFAVHGYPIGGGVSTFIVETDEASWRAVGLDDFDLARVGVAVVEPEAGRRCGLVTRVGRTAGAGRPR